MLTFAAAHRHHVEVPSPEGILLRLRRPRHPSTASTILNLIHTIDLRLRTALHTWDPETTSSVNREQRECQIILARSRESNGPNISTSTFPLLQPLKYCSYNTKLTTPTAAQLATKYAIFSFTSCVLLIASLYSPTPGSGTFAFPSQNAPTCCLAISSAATFAPATSTAPIIPILEEKIGYNASVVEHKNEKRTSKTVSGLFWEGERENTLKAPLAWVVRVLCNCCSAILEYFAAFLEVSSYFWRLRMEIEER